jgi:thiamine-monophosphate kinase
MDEFALIEKLLVPAAGRRDDVVLGIGDDGAVLEPPAGEQLVVVADTLVDGVHFPRGFPAADIAYRALAVNLSDLAAMGATPYWATLALTIPQADETWLRPFTDTLRDTLGRYRIALVGGDTTRGPLTVTVQLIGGVPRGTALTRHGARSGDAIYVSGCTGDAAAGLQCLQRATATSPDEDTLIEKFRHPQPRLALGVALRGIASACIDISDGLLADLGHIAARSGCGAEIVDASVLLSPALRRECAPDVALSMALTGGDDYELCFTVPPSAQKLFAQISGEFPEVRLIGKMIAGSGVQVVGASEAWRTTQPGFRHF